MRNSRVPHEQCQPHPATCLWGGGGGDSHMITQWNHTFFGTQFGLMRSPNCRGIHYNRINKTY